MNDEINPLDTSVNLIKQIISQNILNEHKFPKELADEMSKLNDIIIKNILTSFYNVGVAEGQKQVLNQTWKLN